MSNWKCSEIRVKASRSTVQVEMTLPLASHWEKISQFRRCLFLEWKEQIPLKMNSGDQNFILLMR